MYKYVKYGADRKIKLTKNRYAENNNLAVQMVSYEEEYGEPWSSLTVNLSVKCDKNCAFIDTNNNGEDIIKWLEDNNIAHLTGRMMPSGFCLYPEVKFTDAALKDMAGYYDN